MVTWAIARMAVKGMICCVRLCRRLAHVVLLQLSQDGCDCSPTECLSLRFRLTAGIQAGTLGE